MNRLNREKEQPEPTPLFYRQTDNAEILQFREELNSFSEEEIYKRLTGLQEEKKFDFALECFDEIERRHKSDRQMSNS